MLTASEFLQMSGRAGRRGMDRLGHVVVVGTPYQSQAEAQALATAPPDPLGSNFTPTYSMVLNLLQRHTLEEARFLIARSFGAYLDDLRSHTRGGRKRGAGRDRDAPPAPDSSHVWRRFMHLRNVLHEFDYLDDDHPTRRGVMTAAIRAQHELIVAEALFRDILNLSNPADLAAVFAALVAEELRPRMWVKRRPRGAAVQALGQLTVVAREIRQVERAHGLWLQTRVYADTAGLIQFWASGAEWEDLLRWTNLGEGDVVRSVRRTLDLIEQVQRAPMQDPEVADRLRAAAAALNRDPITEIF